MTGQPSFTTQLHDQTDYSKPGVQRKTLVKTEDGSISVICLTAGTVIPEHTATRNVAVTILEGSGTLTLNGQAINLQPGVFVYIPAKAPHSLQAQENLAFLHT